MLFSTIADYWKLGCCRMRRNLAWGLAAFYPLLGCAYAATGGGVDPPIFVPNTEFWVVNWLFVLGGTMIAQILFFSAHALVNRNLSVASRFIWFVGIFFVAPIMVIPYWWF